MEAGECGEKREGGGECGEERREVGGITLQEIAGMYWRHTSSPSVCSLVVVGGD